MGLAASQARFLAITARKSDCEQRSMAIAQEKLSITRELSRISDEYQRALDATKLIWDGETEDGTVYDLSYDVMMNPSELNGYSPFLVTNRTGQIVLDDQLANACEAAGLDQISSSGSLAGRNNFVRQLAKVGYISSAVADVITGDGGDATIEWSDKAGFGGQMLDKSVAQAMTITTMVNYFENVLDPAFINQLDPNSVQYQNYQDLATKLTFTNDGTTYGTVYRNGSKLTEDFTIVDLLTSNVTINFDMSEEDFVDALTDLVKDRSATEGAIDGSNPAMSALADIVTLFKAVLPADVQTEETQAFEFALNETIQQLADNTDSYGSPFNTATEDLLTAANNQNGGIYNKRKGMFVSLSNMVEMFLTNYAIALGGYESGYYNSIKASDSNFVTNDYNYMYVMNQPESVYEEKDMMVADFINVLYNNICNHGWTRNENVNDNDFLQNALKNGQYFISSLNTDLYYYQDHYTANGCVGEVTDDEAVTLAEAEYTNQKNKLNYKEETLEIEMKNLDLEISALTTEYDTVKSMISKNVEKIFTMFNS